jgi:branched-chain amino acid transport system substrate-binding protein
MFRKRVLNHTLKLALAAGYLSLSVAAHAAACDVKIGVVAVLSGPAASWGIALREGVALAAQEVNATGGLQVGGEKCTVSYVALDSKYTGEASASAGNQLASQGIKIIIGPVGSPEVTGIKPIAARNGILVMANSYAKDVIGPRWPLVFHFGPGPSGWADPIIKAAKARFNMKKVVVMAPNDQGGTDVASVDAAMYKKNGIDTAEEYYQRGTTNFAPIVLRVLAGKPDAVELASSPPGDVGTIIKQLRDAGFNGPIGHLGGPGTEEIVRVAGGLDVVKNMYWYEPVVRDPELAKVDEQYKAAFQKDAPANTLFYQWLAASRMVLKAISKAGTATDTKKVAEALRGLPVEDPNMGHGQWIGKEFFGVNQELSFPFGIGMIVDGKYLPVQKVPAATGK